MQELPRELSRYLKLRARADHPDTPVHEAKTARKLAAKLAKKHPGLETTAQEFQRAQTARAHSEARRANAASAAAAGSPGSWAAFLDEDVVRAVWDAMRQQAAQDIQKEGASWRERIRAQALRHVTEWGSKHLDQALDILGETDWDEVFKDGDPEALEDEDEDEDEEQAPSPYVDTDKLQEDLKEDALVEWAEDEESGEPMALVELALSIPAFKALVEPTDRAAVAEALRRAVVGAVLEAAAEDGLEGFEA